MKRKKQGITVVELLLVLSVVGVLLVSVAPNGFARSREVKRIDGVMSDIMAAIAMARSAVVNPRRPKSSAQPQ
ncbi:MAG: prepilin-type N-terminal cleavage/methylation domain-containing protein [Gammaproteobacteria bacterium]|nr:prepilin-type N-terminal cleavage/methylation domain-containing protein [Gammaproteobacteria bacterium]